MGSVSNDQCALVVPIKSFSSAKGRLESALGPELRESLARWSAQRVVQAIPGATVIVVCDDPEVTNWCSELGLIHVAQDEPGLDAAAMSGVREATSRGCKHVVVAHSDLAHPEDLEFVAYENTITLVPDLDFNGTNVIALPTQVADAKFVANDYEFAYGEGSFARHLQIAEATGVGLIVIDDSPLSIDIDTEEDLEISSVREILPWNEVGATPWNQK